MFKMLRIANGDIVWVVIGQLQADDVGELSALLAVEATDQAVVLDLKDLILADRRVVCFLRDCERQGIELRHCPGYIRSWIGRELDSDP
ncbi:hypothetical protein DyAD56_13960 [Dyella sp. AD56]|uniref:hypothetical protein n=1 Tax=Dyella sp. AD56 TaxID=1528744 RepID=UPI000C82ABFD|nr:hypothetical protein [Dyella sp. AD56]PMQ04629.1 hypothetical protein DyAD56_13960 [Dyella sp. AD56]